MVDSGGTRVLSNGRAIGIQGYDTKGEHFQTTQEEEVGTQHHPTEESREAVPPEVEWEEGSTTAKEQ